MLLPHRSDGKRKSYPVRFYSSGGVSFFQNFSENYLDYAIIASIIYLKQQNGVDKMIETTTIRMKAKDNRALNWLLNNPNYSREFKKQGIYGDLNRYTFDHKKLCDSYIYWLATRELTYISTKITGVKS